MQKLGRVSLNLIVFSVLALSLVLAVSCEDFCNPKLCHKGVKHIACQPAGLQSTCPIGNATQVKLGAIQQAIVDQHNQWRSQLAIGNLTNYASAARMLQMKWDDNLATVAGFNARSCTFKHDQCRSTTAYPLSGQNIAASSGTGGFGDNAKIIRNFIDGFYNERRYANMNVMKAYKDIPDKTIGHFTEMSQEKNGHVGCAFVRYHSAKWFNTYLVCNYEYNNMIGAPVYMPGPACSQCPAGTSCSKQYPGLCV